MFFCTRSLAVFYGAGEMLPAVTRAHNAQEGLSFPPGASIGAMERKSARGRGRVETASVTAKL